MREKLYYNVPSDWALTKKEAYEKAVYLMNLDRQSARDAWSGITWQGDHGTDQYADWSELPGAKD